MSSIFGAPSKLLLAGEKSRVRLCRRPEPRARGMRHRASHETQETGDRDYPDHQNYGGPIFITDRRIRKAEVGAYLEGVFRKILPSREELWRHEVEFGRRGSDFSSDVTSFTDVLKSSISIQFETCSSRYTPVEDEPNFDHS